MRRRVPPLECAHAKQTACPVQGSMAPSRCRASGPTADRSRRPRRRAPPAGHRRNNVLQKQRVVRHEKLGQAGDARQPVVIRKKGDRVWTGRQLWERHPVSLHHNPAIRVGAYSGHNRDGSSHHRKQPNKWRTKIGYNLIRRIGYEVASDSVGHLSEKYPDFEAISKIITETGRPKYNRLV